MNTLMTAGRVGAELTPRERLARLESAARAARTVYEAHRCHGCEISMAQAEFALEEFRAEHRELASA